MQGINLFFFIPNHSLKIWSKTRINVFHVKVGQNIPAIDDNIVQKDIKYDCINSFYPSAP